MIRAASRNLLLSLGVCAVGSLSAQEPLDEVLDEVLTESVETVEQPKPDIGEKIYSQGVKWNTVVKQVEIRIADETPLRQELTRLQQRLASLYSGVELVNLLEQTKNQIAIREAELATRANSFDQKMLTIKQELEELRRAAVAVGAGSELEAMIESANQAAKIPVGQSAANQPMQPKPTTNEPPSNRSGFNFSKPLRGATQPSPRTVKPF